MFVHPPADKITEKTVLVVIHPALGIFGGYYAKLAENMAYRYNWIVIVQEQRGQGTSSWRASRRENWSYWTPISYDFDLHLSIIRTSYPSNPLFILGHSVGGILWSLWMAAKVVEGKEAEVKKQISGFLCMASGSIHHAIHPSSSLLAYSWFIASVVTILGWLPGEKLGFGGPAEAKGFMLDWCSNIWTGRWQPRDCPHQDITSAFKRIPVPAHFTTIDKDTFTPPICSSTFAEHLNPATTSYATIVSDSIPEYKNLEPDQAHIRWARGTAFLPIMEAFVNRTLKRSVGAKL